MFTFRSVRSLAFITASSLFVTACGDKPSDSGVGPDPAVQYTLTIVTDSSVVVSAQPGSHSAGTSVSYSITAAPGYSDPAVVIDTVLSPLSGTVQMNRDRVLYAAARVRSTAPSGTDPIAVAAQKLLTSTDPVREFQALITTVAQQSTVVSEDSLLARLRTAERAMLNASRDGQDLNRLGAALHGRTFVWGGEAAPTAALRTSRSVETGRLSTDRHSPTALRSTVGASESLSDADFVQTTYIHTNGINNTPLEAVGGMYRMANAARFTNLPVNFTDGRVRYLLHYNHTAMAGMLTPAHFCSYKFVATLTDRTLAANVVLWFSGRAAVERQLGCTFTSDLEESVAQVANIWLNLPAPTPTDAILLREKALDERTRGSNVILTAHSQGNLMTMQALQEVGDLQAGKACVGYISIAGPLYYESVGKVSGVDGYLAGFGRAKDMMALVPGPKAALMSNAFAQREDEEIGRVLSSQPAILRYVNEIYLKLIAGVKVHGLTESYLESGSTTQDSIRQSLRRNYDNLAQQCTGGIRGTVVDAQTSRPIPNAMVQVVDRDVPRTLGTTDTRGVYSGNLEARRFSLRITAEGYNGATVEDVDVRRFNTVQVIEVPLVKQSDGRGAISGAIRNARNNNLIGGATVTLRAGVNATSGAALASTTASANGTYRFADLAPGTYTVSATAANYAAGIRTGISVGHTEISAQDVLLSPSDNDIRIVLRWGAAPSDLDSHLTGPTASGGRFHVYYASRGAYDSAPFAGLDVDDTSSYGPETITVTRLLSGMYRYSVHNYSNRNSIGSTALGTSGAVVEVYRRGRLMNRFAVPSAPGNLWTVFEMDANGTVTPINQMSDANAASFSLSTTEGSVTGLQGRDAALIGRIAPKIQR